MKYWYLAFVSLTVFLSGCEKDSGPDQNCAKIKNVKIVAEKTSFNVGDEIRLQINEMPDIALYIWTLG